MSVVIVYSCQPQNLFDWGNFFRSSKLMSYFCMFHGKISHQLVYNLQSSGLYRIIQNEILLFNNFFLLSSHQYIILKPLKFLYIFVRLNQKKSCLLEFDANEWWNTSKKVSSHQYMNKLLYINASFDSMPRRFCSHKLNYGNSLSAHPQSLESAVVHWLIYSLTLLPFPCACAFPSMNYLPGKVYKMLHLVSFLDISASIIV